MIDKIKKLINDVFDRCYTKGSPDYPKLIIFQRQKAINELLTQLNNLFEQKKAERYQNIIDAEKRGWDAADEFFNAEYEQKVREIFLRAIADEPEFPGDMPDELWKELDGNRENVTTAMQSTVRLTKNGITDRFLQALKDRKEGEDG